jgi:nucleoside-diphosphate-sugar epimerase
LSSVKACGERSYDKPFSEADAEAPEDYYGKTKLEAEERVLDFAAATNMDVVIIRPPLVYGPGVKGNFLRLLGWVRRGVPLPFAAVDNRRSLIGLRNLVDVLERAAAAPNGFRGKFFVSDAADTSTPALISQIAASMHRPSRLVRVSPVLLEWGARLMGEREMAYRLLGNLQVDASLIRSRLGWHPAVSMTEELRATAAWYLRRNSP